MALSGLITAGGLTHKSKKEQPALAWNQSILTLTLKMERMKIIHTLEFPHMYCMSSWCFEMDSERAKQLGGWDRWQMWCDDNEKSSQMDPL